MGRLLAIDYGRKRCGIAVTDTLRIVASALETVPTAQLIDFVKSYCAREQVDMIVVGLPRDMHGDPSESMPGMPIEFFDERFTSVLAHRTMLDSGLGRMKRRDKATVDRTAACIILNDFLQSRRYTELTAAARSNQSSE